ncbi:MAG: 50S ribosomal protein L1 [Planctomycetes bacterium]|nr:50S ribosomal protein L1 [Planctomycetota bacterium]
MAERSKRYRESLKLVDRARKYELAEAVKLLKSFKPGKFDETIEIAMKLGVDPKQSDQVVRGSVSLPKGIGKSKRVIAFCVGDKADAAKKAGAIEAGGEDLVKKVEGGWMDFDVAIASPDVMRLVGKLGRILGPQGKMPSPKSGTVVDDVETAVREFSAGKVEYRTDAGGNVHAIVGKLSFSPEDLMVNIKSFIEHIEASRAPSVKGIFVQKVSISASMSPGIKVAM